MDAIRGEEAMHNITVPSVISDTVKIDIHAVLVNIGNQILKIFLASEIIDDIYIVKHFLLNATVHPAGKLNRHVIHAFASKLSEHILRFLKAGNFKWSGKWNTYNLFYLVYSSKVFRLNKLPQSGKALGYVSLLGVRLF